MPGRECIRQRPMEVESLREYEGVPMYSIGAPERSMKAASAKFGVGGSVLMVEPLDRLYGSCEKSAIGRPNSSVPGPT